MSIIPEALQYTKEHEWVLAQGGIYTMGITDYAQEALGDIVYVQLPRVGENLTAGAVCGEIESTKSVSEIYAPVSGVVQSVNEALTQTPESINSDPYGIGWLVKIETSTPPVDLLNSTQYGDFTA